MGRKVEDKSVDSVMEIHTSLSVARKEIWKRWRNKELREKVDKYLNGSIPDFLKKEPCALLVRQITSPNIEFFLFVELAGLMGLKPLFVEFKEDKFTSCNQDKYYRCNLHFFEGIGKQLGFKIRSKKIIDFDFYDGKKIKDIRTLWDESLLDFHHRFIKEACPLIKDDNIVDVSEWVKKNGKTARKYYEKYMAWFICHGVLFEDFLLTEEDKFTKEIALPSIKKIEKQFGVKPLIVPLSPIEDRESCFWWYYPKKVKKIFNKIKKQK